MDKQERLLKEIKEMVSFRLDFNKEPTDEEVMELITCAVLEKAREYYLDIEEKEHLIRVVFNAMRRLGVLQPLLEDSSVTEIMVNGPEQVFIEKEGRIVETDIRIESREKLEDMIQNIVAGVNRTVNEASPLVDARLKDGSRVGVILQPIALNGPILTIRKFPQEPLTMEDLIRYGSISEEAAEILRILVEAKYNIFICGGTGSGKTTFLNALSNFIPPDERVITIEDSAELQINRVKNLVRTETRNVNTEGKGGVGIRDLIKISLRMRPERIVVGEVRGEEALDMLQAMNTGHDGSLSTGHANSCRDMLNRLATMVLMAAPLPHDAINQQIASAIDIIIHLSRLRDKSRRVVEIVELKGYENREFSLNPLFVFEEKGEKPDGSLQGELKGTGNLLVRTQKLRMAGKSLLGKVENEGYVRETVGGAGQQERT